MESGWPVPVYIFKEELIGKQDQIDFFNYNESTKEWYAEHGFSENDLKGGYSPAVFHPSSKAYKLEQGIKMLINNKQNDLEGTSPINNSGPIPGQ